MKRVNYILLVLTFLGVVLPGMGQNLVQNSGFEAATDWDSLWILSTTAPSTPTAVATEVTSDAHEGLRSVELSNTVANMWTYFHTDTAVASVNLLAGERYEVRGWIRSLEEGKDVELSFLWNDSKDVLVFYSGNPDPVSNPDWFLVKDTLSPSADYSDGYLNLGFRAGKNGPVVAGKLLVDDFSVILLPSTQTEMLDFSIPEQTGPAVIDNLLHTITLEVPFGTDVSALIPTLIVSQGATTDPPGGIPQDFSGPALYRVTAEDGITFQDWTVDVTFTPPTAEAEILQFEMAEQTGPANIDSEVHIVLIEVAFGTDETSIAPTISVSDGASVSPPSGVATDFSTPLIYTVTAEDGVTTQDYIVAAMVAPASTETEILSFVLPGQSGPSAIDHEKNTVSVELPYATDVTNLVPAIGLSAGASIDPDSGVAADFSDSVLYRVTAEDGTTVQDWKVAVGVLPNTAADLIGFTLPQQAGPAIIDSVQQTVTTEVPYGTDPTSLIPEIEVSSGAYATPAGGDTVDFSVPVIFVVTAADSSTAQNWTVQVVVLPNTETEITGFHLDEAASPALIDSLVGTITIEVPYGTDVTSMVPTLLLSPGATVDPQHGIASDFSAPVVYSVTAEDGVTLRMWTVTVVVLPNTESAITGFDLHEVASTTLIDTLQGTVFMEVPYGTDLTALVPTLELSPGATVDPAPGVATDFSTQVEYTVTAEDGSNVQTWTVTVVILPNTETDIVSFYLPEQTGPAVIDTASHSISIEVAKDTDLSTLMPVIELSAGATIDPSGGVVADFSAMVIFTVTAGDGATTQAWSVLVSLDPAVSITPVNPSGAFKVYPNPARERIFIETSTGGDIYLLDVMGRIVLTRKDATPQTTLQVSDLERGTYFLQLNLGDRREVHPLILE